MASHPARRSSHNSSHNSSNNGPPNRLRVPQVVAKGATNADKQVNMLPEGLKPTKKGG